jgi:hypothetical protein
MKTILFRNYMTVLVAVMAIFFISSCKNTEEKTLVKCITYDVMINHDNAPSAFRELWWQNNIEESKRDAFIKILFDKIDSNKITVTDENGKTLTMDDIKSRMIIKDTVIMMRKKEPMEYYDTVVTLTIEPKQINMIRFKESWTYDPETFEITKHIQSYGLSYSKKNLYSKIHHPEPFFWVSCTDEENFSHPQKVLSERITYCTNLFEKCNGDFLNTIKIEGDTTDIRAYLKDTWEAALNDKLKNVKDLDHATMELKDITLDTIKSQTYRSIRKSFAVKPTDAEIDKNMDEYIMNYGKTLYFHERWLVDLYTMEIKKDVQIISPGINIKKNGLFVGSRYFYSLVFKSKLWRPL